MTLLYFGPETMMPVASFLAAVAGAILMFWRRIIGFGRAIFGRMLRRRGPTGANPGQSPAAAPDRPAQGR